MESAAVTPQAIITVGYGLAALFSVAGSFAWLRFVNRRTSQSSAGKTPDLHGLSNAATTTALAMFCAGASFIFSTFV